MSKLEILPKDLPEPIDDGKCEHLKEKSIPDIQLLATNGKLIQLKNTSDNLVICCYPMTGRPDVNLPDEWEQIPGARGCTPQACSFRDHYQELKDLNFSVFGLSTQSTEYQREAVERLHLPFPLLSDEKLEFISALKLPTFTVDNLILIKRLTLIIQQGKIVKYFYPVFPPDENINEVIKWITQNQDN